MFSYFNGNLGFPGGHKLILDKRNRILYYFLVSSAKPIEFGVADEA